MYQHTHSTTQAVFVKVVSHEKVWKTTTRGNILSDAPDEGDQVWDWWPTGSCRPHDGWTTAAAASPASSIRLAGSDVRLRADVFNQPKTADGKTNKQTNACQRRGARSCQHVKPWQPWSSGGCRSNKAEDKSEERRQIRTSRSPEVSETGTRRVAAEAGKSDRNLWWHLTVEPQLKCLFFFLKREKEDIVSFRWAAERISECG